MGVIKPSFTLTANSSSATTDAGPLSVALSLSVTDSLDVTKVRSKILDVKGDHTTSDGAGILWDASDFTASGDAGTDGAFVYTGFKPAYAIVKCTSHSGESWWIGDNKRPGRNVNQKQIDEQVMEVENIRKDDVLESVLYPEYQFTLKPMDPIRIVSRRCFDGFI